MNAAETYLTWCKNETFSTALLTSVLTAQKTSTFSLMTRSPSRRASPYLGATANNKPSSFSQELYVTAFLSVSAAVILSSENNDEFVASVVLRLSLIDEESDAAAAAAAASLSPVWSLLP
jgi:hypothetical protein